MASLEPPRPDFTFAAHPSTSSFTVPLDTYLARHEAEASKSGSSKYTYIANGAMVFDSSTTERVLLIQRASGDSMPDLWEVPGGGCDKEDSSILESVARELWEEAGLIATTIGPQVGSGQVFLSRSGKLICKFHFLVDAKKGADGRLHVKLDPREHQNYVWATEEEVQVGKVGKVGDLELKFTSSEQERIVLEAFKARKAQDAMEKVDMRSDDITERGE